jgi:hypothetical protein
MTITTYDNATLNPEYNRLLNRWHAESGKPQTITCEHCNKSIEGKQVFERYCWCCEECSESEEVLDMGGSGGHDKEDFHADDGYGADWLD